MPKWTIWLLFLWFGTGPRPELREAFKGNTFAILWWAIVIFSAVMLERYELPIWRKGWQRLREL
jgi:hypothetical protein